MLTSLPRGLVTALFFFIPLHQPWELQQGVARLLGMWNFMRTLLGGLPSSSQPSQGGLLVLISLPIGVGKGCLSAWALSKFDAPGLVISTDIPGQGWIVAEVDSPPRFIYQRREKRC